jgi:Fungal specific transcription factor domain/Fungal Zn(2)-Cys(6) binuclear cluster domain
LGNAPRRSPVRQVPVIVGFLPKLLKMMAVAIQPALPRPTESAPVPIAAATRPQPKRRMSGKENLVHFKTASSTTNIGPITNIRPRRERPCDACRRRKSRCVIHEGAVLCVLCEFHKQDCTFVQDPQPRKRKVVIDADRREGSPKKRCVTKSHPIAAADVIKLHHQAIRLMITDRSVDVSSTRKPSTPRVAARPSASPAQKPVVQVQHNVLGETLGLQSNKHGRYIGLTSPFDPTLIGLAQFDARNESIFSLGTLRRVNDHETFIMYADENSQDFGDDADALDAINRIVAPHGPALINLYFRIVHPSFPIIQKRVFLERMRTGDRNFSPPLLAGMYILALNWWSHDPKLAPLRRPDASQLDAIASKSLATAMQRPKLSTVQAGLLLLQRPEADSWSLTTQLVAIGQELGLHLNCSTWSIPLWERELRKRIAWALYMQDKWSSLIHGRPSHIFAANWAVKPMADDEVVEEEGQTNPNTVYETDEEKDELKKGQVLFSQMILLTAIMAEIMDTFYTQVAIQDFASAGKESTRLILDRAKPVQIKLKEWYSKLPSQVRMDSVIPKRLSSTGKTSLIPGWGPVTNLTRLPPSRLLRHRNHPPPPHRAVPRRLIRPVLGAHLPIRRKDAPDIRHGLRQSSQARTVAIVLVLPLQDQLHLDRDFRWATLGYGACERRSGFLQSAAQRVQMDSQRVKQEGRVS